MPSRSWSAKRTPRSGARSTAAQTEVLVNDSHGAMFNLRPAELDRRARVLQGQKAWSMVEGAGPDRGFGVALFVGYHARAGHPRGTIAHTYSGRPTATRLNGRLVGETGINAAVLGAWDVPVGLVTGDDALAEEVAEWLPWAERVVVKDAAGGSSAASLHPAAAAELIAESAKTAVRRATVVGDGGLRPLEVERPVVIEVDYVNGVCADFAAVVPGRDARRRPRRALRSAGLGHGLSSLSGGRPTRRHRRVLTMSKAEPYGQIDRLAERAETLAGAWAARARTSTTVGRERALLRLFGVGGLDAAGRPLAWAVVDRYLAGGRRRLGGGVVMPFAMALVEYDLTPQRLALDVASGAVDLGMEGELLRQADRRAVAEEEARRLADAAIERIDANRTARRELLGVLGDPARPWIGASIPDPEIEEAIKASRRALDAGADVVQVEVPIGRELTERLRDAGMDAPVWRGRAEDLRSEGLDHAPTGSQRALTVLRGQLDEIAAQRRNYVRLAAVPPALGAPESAVVAAFERVDVVDSDPMSRDHRRPRRPGPGPRRPCLRPRAARPGRCRGVALGGAARRRPGPRPRRAIGPGDAGRTGARAPGAGGRDRPRQRRSRTSCCSSARSPAGSSDESQPAARAAAEVAIRRALYPTLGLSFEEPPQSRTSGRRLGRDRGRGRPGGRGLDASSAGRATTPATRSRRRGWRRRSAGSWQRRSIRRRSTARRSTMPGRRSRPRRRRSSGSPMTAGGRSSATRLQGPERVRLGEDSVAERTEIVRPVLERDRRARARLGPPPDRPALSSRQTPPGSRGASRPRGARVSRSACSPSTNTLMCSRRTGPLSTSRLRSPGVRVVECLSIASATVAASTSDRRIVPGIRLTSDRGRMTVTATTLLAQSTSIAWTPQIGGRLSAIRCQLAPSSVEP